MLSYISHQSRKRDRYRVIGCCPGASEMNSNFLVNEWLRLPRGRTTPRLYCIRYYAFKPNSIVPRSPLSSTASVASSMEPAKKDVFSPAQWKVLLAIADTVVAELTEEEIQNMIVDSRSNAVIKNIRSCKEFARLKFSSDSSTFSSAVHKY